MKTTVQVPLMLDTAKKQLEHDLKLWFHKMQEYGNQLPEEVAEKISLLAKIRKELYESLNQLQHVALLLGAAEQLQAEYPQITNWTWHPRQTSHPDFADLTGYVAGKIFLHAEATASAKPSGVIDQRMKKTLAGLASKQGLQFYFVRTSEMRDRAATKIRKAGYSVRVVCLQ